VAESLEQHLKKLTEESNRGLESAPAPQSSAATGAASGASSHPGRRHWVPAAPQGARDAD
jgi:hypothetical protein